MKTAKLFVFVVLVSLACGCAANRHSGDLSFMDRLLEDNIGQTPYTALVRVKDVNIARQIRDDSGRAGYREFRVTADVLETFKGPRLPRVDYLVIVEATLQGPQPGSKFIVSLRYSPERGCYYVPGNGYALPASERLISVARAKR